MSASQADGPQRLRCLALGDPEQPQQRGEVPVAPQIYQERRGPGGETCLGEVLACGSSVQRDPDVLPGVMSHKRRLGEVAGAMS
jgi:hypothetical protein